MSESIDSRPVVCHLVEDLHVGGIEELIHVIATGLNSSKYRVIVCAIEEGGATADRLRAAGVPLTILGYRNYHRLSTLRAIAAHLRANHVAILHCHAYFANMAGRLANVLARVPIVFTTAYSLYYERKLRHRLMEWWWVRGTDRIIAAAEAIRDYTAAQSWIPKDKFIVIHDAARDMRAQAASEGVDRERARSALGVPAGAFVIGCVARLDPVKGHRVLLEAMAAVTRKAPEAVLVLVGDGPQRPALEAHARALGIERVVRFLGTRSDIAALLSAFDVFTLASNLREGGPLSILEAMSLELPVVATRLGGVGEQVEDGATGLLVPPGDAAALGQALQRLRDDRALARRLGQAGRRRYDERFSPAVMLHKIEALYDEHVARASGRGPGRQR